MKLRHVLKCVVLLVVLTLFAGSIWNDITVICQTETLPAGTRDNRADDFALTDQNGRSFHLSQLRGKVVLLFFGYTHCPDACPTTMAKLSRVSKLLGPDAGSVMILFASVDPDRDTPNILKSYLAYFHMNSIGLTGTKEEIDAVVKQYGAW